VSERSIDLVLKTSEPKGSVGSNPTASSISNQRGKKMQLKTFIAAAVIALTAACSPAAETEAVEVTAAEPTTEAAAAEANEAAAEAPAVEAAPAAQ
jgi:hypothetical protein